VIKSGWF